MAARIWKIKIFSLALYPKAIKKQRVYNLLEIALSLTVFEIINIFHLRENSRWRQNSQNKKFYRAIASTVYSTQRVQNLLKIAPSLMVFKIINICNLRQNSRSLSTTLFSRIPFNQKDFSAAQRVFYTYYSSVNKVYVGPYHEVITV